MKSRLVGVIAVAGLAGLASGQDHAIDNFSGGTQFISYYTASTDTVGWRFTVSEEITVTELGGWNNDSSQGIGADHEVGIWDDQENLLTETVVTPSSRVEGAWRFEDAPDVTLVPGVEYTIGMVYTDIDGDNYISSASSVTTSSEVTWTISAYPLIAGLGFTYPQLDSSSVGRFGPNFIYTTGGACFFQSGCAGDVTGDEVVDVSDFFAFLDLFSAGDMCADVDESGSVDVGDFFLYLDLFSQGC